MPFDSKLMTMQRLMSPRGATSRCVDVRRMLALPARCCPPFMRFRGRLECAVSAVRTDDRTVTGGERFGAVLGPSQAVMAWPGAGAPNVAAAGRPGSRSLGAWRADAARTGSRPARRRGRVPPSRARVRMTGSDALPDVSTPAPAVTGSGHAGPAPRRPAVVDLRRRRAQGLVVSVPVTGWRNGGGAERFPRSFDSSARAR